MARDDRDDVRTGWSDEQEADLGGPALRARTRRRPRLTSLQALALVATVTTGAVLAGASLVTATDPDRFPDFPTTVWSSVTTVTTVGYGEVVPVSPGHANPSGLSALLH
jgi:hypothetical protein